MAVIPALFVGCVATYLGNTPNTAAELDKAELRDAEPYLIPEGAYPSGQACWTRWLLQNLQRVVK